MDALYVDLDGTLLGPGGSLLRAPDGGTTLLGARAVEACARAGAEVVIMTGRGQTNVREDARLLGQTSFIFEAGSCVVIDGEQHWLTGDLMPADGLSIHDQIAAAGAPALLLDHFADRLEEFPSWEGMPDREVSHLLRGHVDTDEADRLLADRGHADLRLLDNGMLHTPSPRLAGLDEIRAYHLVPRTASKAGGVAFHMRARGYEPARCIAVGDSREDLAVAPYVGAFWVVANAVERDPGIREAIAAHTNVRVAEGAYGEGVYEAVVTELAARR